MKKLIKWLLALLGIKQDVPAPVVVPEPVPTPEPVIIPMPEPEPEPLPPAAETPVYIPPVIVEVPAPAPPVIAPPIHIPTLLDSPITWGVAFKESDLSNQQVIQETYKQFRSVTGENSMKPGHVQPKKGVFDFTDAKALVKIAKANKLRVHAHAGFVWPSQEKNLPEFWHEAAKDQTKYIALLKNSVQTTIRAFVNDIFSWDITNETHQDNGMLRPCYALTHMGPTYPEQIANWVLEIQSSAKLFLSDYDFETASKKATVMIEYAGQLRKKGLIHGISSQMHTILKMDYKVYKKRLDEMANQGLLVHLSEVDFRNCSPSDEPLKAAKFKEIAKGFRTLPLALQYGCTVWSHTAGRNFYNYKLKPQKWDPVIFDDNFQGGTTLPAILEVR